VRRTGPGPPSLVADVDRPLIPVAPTPRTVTSNPGHGARAGSLGTEGTLQT